MSRQPQPKESDFPKREEDILRFWEQADIFKKSLERSAGRKKFIFYEGPPTANGLPHIGHAETRAFKDVVLRYKTMRGFYVPRRAGWDTHGLPVEIEVEKELGFSAKQEIEEYGVAKFNAKCKESVWKYKDEWERFTKRLGFWLDLDNPYITYETEYIETLWWIIKKFAGGGFLYKGFKVLSWCPRCGTGLSSHELAQGYKKVKDTAVYVKFKVNSDSPKWKDTFILSWTTTPWTLPGNVALAIGRNITYVLIKAEVLYKKDAFAKASGRKKGKQEYYIVSKKRAGIFLGKKIENQDAVYEFSDAIEQEIDNRMLEKLSYEPLFDIPQLKSPLSHKVYFADFVTEDEGTGVVHTAVMYGEDDYRLGDEIGLPKFHTVDESGRFIKSINYGLGGGFVKDPQIERTIIEYLSAKGLLLMEEKYEHDYPFCWRCSSPTLYYARSCWWVKTSTFKQEMITNNRKINWIPEHIKEGRFGEFLNELRDWAFSRERYWGTPLPIWECTKCKNWEAVGSRKELANKANVLARNRYFALRHGQAESNVKGIASHSTTKYGLTKKGRKQVEKVAKEIVAKKIDLIFCSDVLRAKQTADILGKKLDLPVFADKRLREIDTGKFNNKPSQEYHKFYSSFLEYFYKKPPRGENLTDVRKRVLDFIQDIERKYEGKNILIVSHEYPIWMLYTGLAGYTNKEAILLKKAKGDDFVGLAEIIELEYKTLPRNLKQEIDLHRPFVDNIELKCRLCKAPMRRVPEVVDVWFDSGSMPFAQAHYPFFDREIAEASLSVKRKLDFPADFITEGVDQTRGWFYTLLAVSTLLGKGTPYRNVISLGHILDKYGQKMSKSKGNVVDPREMINRFGADALRWYFYTINSPGDLKRFDEKDLSVKLRGFINILWNVVIFFNTYGYGDKRRKLEEISEGQLKEICSKNVLDKWIVVRLQKLINDTTVKMDLYDITAASRMLEEFSVGDLSQWFIRRSRARFQHPSDNKELRNASLVLSYVLINITKLLAPFVPFVSEMIWQGLRKKIKIKQESVHLCDWPKTNRLSKKDLALLEFMQKARDIVSEVLRLRSEAGIKVRQPLAALKIKDKKIYSQDQIIELIKQEVNVKEVCLGLDIKNDIELDTRITTELKKEGILRELIRKIQEMRRLAGFHLRDKVLCTVEVEGQLLDLIKEREKELEKATNIKLNLGKTGKPLKIIEIEGIEMKVSFENGFHQKR